MRRTRTAAVALTVGLLIGITACISEEGTIADETTSPDPTAAEATTAAETTAEEPLTSEEAAEAEGEGLSADPGAAMSTVVYEVESSGGEIYVSYRDIEGNNTLYTRPPWRHEFEAQVTDTGGKAAVISGSVTEWGPSGEGGVTCRITIDGEVISEETGDQLAQCSPWQVYVLGP